MSFASILSSLLPSTSGSAQAGWDERPKPNRYSPAQPKPPSPAGPRAPVAPQAAPDGPPAPPTQEAGTMPGEEQVTTADTLGRLSPEQRRDLQAKYEQSGMAGTGGMETFEDWASTHFGEMPPAERLAAMQRAAGMRLPPQTIVPQEELQPGQRSRMAGARVEAGGVLPEGRPLSHYGKTQRDQMGTNIWNPHARMTVFGGTHAHNPDGSLSARAPRKEALDLAAKEAAEYGEGSDAHIIALGQAYNIDVGQYGNDMDLLRADVMREKQRHDRLATKYNTIPNGMGGFRYTPNDAMKAQEKAQNLRSFVNTLKQRYKGMPGFDPAIVDAYAAEPEGFKKLVAYSQGLRGDFLANAAQTKRNFLQNEAMTRQMTRPASSPGMMMRSINEALRNGNYAMAAAIASVNGQTGLAEQYAAMHAADTQAAVELKKNADPNKTMAEKFGREQAAMLALPDGEGRIAGVMGVLGQMVQAQGGTVDLKQLRKDAENLVADHEAGRKNVKHPLVLKRLAELRNDKPAFMALLAKAGITGPAAEQEWKQAGGWMRNSAPAVAANTAAGLAGLVSPLAVGIPLLSGLFGGPPKPPKPKPEKDPFE